MDTLELYGKSFQSRLLLGTALYPSPDALRDAVESAQAQIVTVSLRRESATARSGQGFWRLIEELHRTVLPNTAGCHGVREAVTTAHMAREIFATKWIKLEVIRDTETLHPDVVGLVEAAKILCSEGFEVFPYTTADIGVADRLLEAGCKLLMPWAAPIGSGRGLNDPYALRTLRGYFPDVPLIVDAGIGLPSHAAAAMELGYDAVLLNTAIARAAAPPTMARAFALAIQAGRLAFSAGPIAMRDMATPSTPLFGQAVLP